MMVFLSLLVYFGVSNIALASPITFFGYDQGQGSSSYERLLEWPNAKAAELNLLQNLENTSKESFEEIGLLNRARVGYNEVSSVFDGKGSFAGSGYSLYCNYDESYYGQYPISGFKYLETANRFYIEFEDPIGAMGFYGIDIGDTDDHYRDPTTPATLRIRVTDSSTNEMEWIEVPHETGVTSGGIFYFGFYDPDRTFSKVEFVYIGDGTDVWAFDDMTIGSPVSPSPVPVPSAIWLLGTGLVTLIHFGRKQRH